MKRIESLIEIKKLGIKILPSNHVAYKAKIEHQQARYVAYVSYRALKISESGNAWCFEDSEEAIEAFIEKVNSSDYMRISAAIVYYTSDPLAPYYMLSHAYEFPEGK